MAPLWATPMACLPFPPESNITVNWFGPSAGCLAFHGRMSPLCTQTEHLPTKASIAAFERLDLLLNASTSRGWSCEQDVLSTAWRALCGSPREAFRLTYLLCWKSPISMTQYRQYSDNPYWSSAKSYWTALEGFCRRTRWLHNRKRIKKSERPSRSCNRKGRSKSTVKPKFEKEALIKKNKAIMLTHMSV